MPPSLEIRAAWDFQRHVVTPLSDVLILSCLRRLTFPCSYTLASILDFHLGLSPFRGWTGITSEKVGSWQTDTGRGLNGRFRPSAHGTDYDPLPTGVFYKEVTDYSIAATGVQGTASLIGFSAAKIWGEHSGAEFAPTHIRIPVFSYLGNHT